MTIDRLHLLTSQINPINIYVVGKTKLTCKDAIYGQKHHQSRVYSGRETYHYCR